VQEAYAQLRESDQSVRLYREKILPPARLQVKTGAQEFMTGKVPFLTLIEAQRSLIDLQDRLYESLADYARRLASLERAVGGPLLSPPAQDPACHSAASLGTPNPANPSR
jgi:outer membrane protein TolC